MMFDDAIDRAKHLDDHFRRTGKTVGPLHGLPISLKDNFNIIGKTSATGFCAWADEPMKHESTIVGILRDLGAVAYVKTNVPTAMMIAESVNNCYGRYGLPSHNGTNIQDLTKSRTVNPRNRMLTSGGSSGGESALITAFGSPLGVGTDIGGSLRIPAAMTGIFTIRPSYGRFPHFDARSGMAGQEAVGSVHGPMARSIADLKLFAENVVNARPWLKDPKCIEIPWRPVTLPERLKIAVLWHDDVVQPTPPVARALREVAARLKERGHEVVEWDARGHKTALELLAIFFTADGGKSIKKILEAANEPWRPEMAAYEAANELGVYDLWQLQRQRTDLGKMYLDKWATSGGVDAILLPTTPYAAVKNGQFKYVGYTGVFNILDYTAVSFPTGLHADKNLDVVPADFKPLNDMDETTAKDYDAAAVHGMPISLQLAGRRLQEEKMLEVAERVVKDLIW